MILFGSRAIKHHYPDFYRECKDWDFLVEKDFRHLKSNIKEIEYKYIEPLWDSMTKIEHETHVLYPYKILTLKISHLFYDNNWEKHIKDVQFLYNKGVRYDIKLLEKLIIWWKKVLPKQRRSNLTLNKEEFFKNKINYTIDHDFIHTLINPIPAYLSILKNDSEVEPSEVKWIRQPRIIKDRIVREEIYVMAWERNFKHNRNYIEAYQWMLKNFIQRHAPVWEMLYIIENYERLKVPEFDYIKHINDGLFRKGISYETNDRERIQKFKQEKLQLA